MKIYFVAGEASGDTRGAELMRALRERLLRVQFFGAGGAQMRALGGDHFFDWTAEAVVGLWDVLKKYGYFRRQFSRMLRELEELQPDALILVDYPGFNLRLAHAARARLPRMKIVQYVSPQVWAWHVGRVKRMAADLDLILCIFPFEVEFYENSGLRAEFVGHPLLDVHGERHTDAPRAMDLVGLFPGSRRKEVRKIFPPMLAAARLMAKAIPSLRFEVAAATAALAEMIRSEIVASGAEEELVKVTVGQSQQLMQRATAGMVTSGTATLEAAIFGLPMVILYKVAWLTWVIGKRLVKVPFLGMPNLIAGREIAREFLQEAAEPEAIAAEMLRLMRDPSARGHMQADLAGVIGKLGSPGAGARAAEAVAELLAPGQSERRLEGD
jgi:lipid-A-disaccharide synthase